MNLAALTLPPLVLDLSVLALGLFLLLMEAFNDDTPERPRAFTGWLAITALGVIFAASFLAAPTLYNSNGQLAQFYVADSWAIFFKRIALGSTLLMLILALEFRPILARYIPGDGKIAGTGEFFALPVFTCLGLMWMASAQDFIMIFVALELVTISFYILVAYMRRQSASLEAGVKYFILAALSTGFLVYGIAWIFGVTGQTDLRAVQSALLVLPASSHTAVLFAFALLLVGLGFKIAAAPFQLWVPDVYQGAPTPVTAFLSVASKAAGFIVLIRVANVFVMVPAFAEKTLLVFTALAVLTLLYGNLAALPQLNFKRLLAYSSIAHAGYLLMGLASWRNTEALATVSFYLLGYALMTLLAFLVLVVVQKATGGDDITHFNGLGQRAPFLAFGLTLAILSLAGVPLTVGFAGKFLIFYQAVAAQNWLLVGVGILAVAAGFYYYLKIVRAMYWDAPASNEPIPASGLTKATIAVLSCLIILFGVWWQPVINMLLANVK
jgi:NADH-quinone oxidoreductase subunit N